MWWVKLIINIMKKKHYSVGSLTHFVFRGMWDLGVLIGLLERSIFKCKIKPQLSEGHSAEYNRIYHKVMSLHMWMYLFKGIVLSGDNRQLRSLTGKRSDLLYNSSICQNPSKGSSICHQSFIIFPIQITQ